MNNHKIKHIAIIMDGNGRWAKKRMLPKKIGHRHGMITAEKIVEACKQHEVEYLTLYAFSSENWLRADDEIGYLMDLLREYLRDRVQNLIAKGIRMLFVGNRESLPQDIQNLMHNAELQSSNNPFTLILAISYGGRDEIRRAAAKMATHCVRNDTQTITDDMFDAFINPNNLPDPDLLIRTSGEYRLSNFMLWQLAYTELYFIDILWPDFTPAHLAAAIQDFYKRERRYGK
jgi:undecaprenyl diphosphate synthase